MENKRSQHGMIPRRERMHNALCDIYGVDAPFLRSAIVHRSLPRSAKLAALAAEKLAGWILRSLTQRFN